MRSRYGLLIAVVVSTAALALIGSLAGYYLAGRSESPSIRAATDRSPGTATDRSPETGAGRSPETPAERGPARGGGAVPQTPANTPRQTYRIDRPVYQQSTSTLTLTTAETADGTVRLTFRYRNDSPLPWPLACPTREKDLTSSALIMADGRTVHPTDTWCAAERPGESITVAPGESIDTWGVFPVSPASAEPFSVRWYSFPVLTDVQLR
ncbi:hypothetical protein [Micromonospora sp. DT229]|uniref:hypothetical protein n=1 Tax=Micromonospora sp. DT229 TaxID=3393430 RepID=UPI003CFB659F